MIGAAIVRERHCYKETLVRQIPTLMNQLRAENPSSGAKAVGTARLLPADPKAPSRQGSIPKLLQRREGAPSPAIERLLPLANAMRKLDASQRDSRGSE